MGKSRVAGGNIHLIIAKEYLDDSVDFCLEYPLVVVVRSHGGHTFWILNMFSCVIIFWAHSNTVH